MPYHYGFCPNKRSWDDEMKRLAIPERVPYPELYDGRCTHFTNTHDHNACSIVTIRPGNKSALEVISMLTHEAVHVWQAMRDAIGETHPSSEFEAYSIQAISKNLIKAYEQGRCKLVLRGKKGRGF